MNFTFKLRMVFIFITLLLVMNLSSQVTIGSTDKPVSGSLLQLKNSSSTIGKGLLLPRVKLTDLDNLYPMFEKDDYYVNGVTKNDLDIQHVGLVVYNIGCLMTGEGVYTWTGKNWLPVIPKKIESTDIYKGANSYILEKDATLNIPVQRAFDIWTAYKKSGAVATAAEINEGKVLDLSAVNNLTGALTVEILWEQTDSEASSGVFLGIPTIQGTDKNAVIEVKTGNEFGNALLALKIDGKVLWTWHIWVPDSDPTNLDSQIYCYGGLVWMDRNLGAINTTPKSRKAYGLYYQFGRMLPFKLGNDGQIVKNQNKTGNETTMLTFAIQSTDYIIRPNPGYIDNKYDWYSTTIEKWSNRWGYKSVKSPFDPCPEGWRVPVTNNGNSPWPFGDEQTELPSVWNEGFNYEEVNADIDLGYWPAAGYISDQNGTYSAITMNGSYWSGVSSRFESRKFYRLYFTNPTIMNLTQAALAYGASIRCIGEYNK